MSIFALSVERPVIEQLLSQKSVEFFRLIEIKQPVNHWQLVLTSLNENPTESENLVRKIDPSIHVEGAIGTKFQASPDKEWHHLVTFCFKDPSLCRAHEEIANCSDLALFPLHQGRFYFVQSPIIFKQLRQAQRGRL